MRSSERSADSSSYQRITVLTVLAMVVASLFGCSTLDVDGAIALVLSDEFGGVERNALERAALRWNRHFATDLRVMEAGESQQEVSIYYNELICSYASGRTEVTLPVEIHICRHHLIRESFWGTMQFNENDVFLLFLHELGHVLNIRGHADDPEAVMYESASYDASHGGSFTTADEELFYEANPDLDR